MDAGCVPQLSSATTLVKEKRVIIDQWVAMHNLQRGNIIGLNGHSIFDGQDFSDRDYVMEAMEGRVSVSEPLVSKVTGELSIIVAAPIYAGGIQGGRITGVVYFVPQETFLNDIVSSIKVSPNSRAYMINNSGNTIADATLDTINKQNIEQESKSDASLKELAALHADMRAGNNGFGTFHSAGGDRFAAYAPVENTDGWSVAVTAPKTDYLADTYFGIFLNIAVIVISSLASVVVALKLSTSISVPMRVQGVVKRHGFGGVGQSTHGQHNRLRAPGSIGACSYPAKVFKGMRMAGQMGNQRVTVQNLQVFKVIAEHNILMIKGSIPGAKGSIVLIEK